ncbi:MAG: hypothetical protein L3J07_03735 [Candidatus Magasanikbacteria bacterium]|nr:hypothetical protein [Candidatus Magasanikbacteria bacterium]
MENEKRDRKSWAKLLATLFGFLASVFWILYLVLGAESVPSVSSILMFDDFGLDLPFEISRWWDIPALAFIVYIFTLQEKDLENIKGMILVFIFLFLILILFDNKIFLPLLCIELIYGITLGLYFSEELNNINPIDKITFKEILNFIPKNLLIGIWAGISVGVGVFYGFTIGAVLALVSTLSIWAFALVIIFGRKNFKLLVQTILGTFMMIAVATAFLFGNILADLTKTLVAGGVFIVLGIILIILQSKKKKKVEEIEE